LTVNVTVFTLQIIKHREMTSIKKSLERPRRRWDIKTDLEDIGWGKRGLD
jgi:hypothetical protein